MLDCQEMQQCLQPYLDGELNTRDAVDRFPGASLDICPDCAALYRNEKLFLGLLKKSLPRLHAPPGLERKVTQALNKVSERKQGRAWVRFVSVPSMAVALVAVVAMTTFFGGKKSVPDIVDAAVATK